ncbi:toll-like receptor 4 [Babylonia areolata]|uniref:toll-like receptor 4 n=1 Tax=Babylonia areolata TaxID=304850 RepID=UPI003FD03BFC
MALLLLWMTLLTRWGWTEGVPTSESPAPCVATPCGPCLCSDAGLTVNCSGRSLTAVPDSSLLPPNATNLILHNNRISLLPPSAFEAFPHLRNLDVSNNDLTVITDGVFKGLGELLSLNLSHNQLTVDSLSPEDTPFMCLVSLRLLDLSHNSLGNVSTGRGLSSHSLQWLDLSYNNISSTTESYMINNLFNLTFLDLSHNHLQSLKGLFLGMDNLQKLDLRRNQIPLNDMTYPAEVFDSCQSTLWYLALEGNCQVLSTNHSMKYPDQALSKLTNLKSLSMDGLPYVDFGPGFHSMVSLTNLSLSGQDGGYCFMDTLSNDTFLSMPASLRQLNLSGCGIVRIEMDAFRPLREMEVLDLSFNVDLGFETLGDAFYSLQGSALSVLHINSIIRPYSMCVMVTSWNTRYLRHTSLRDIHAKNNQLEAFCEGALNNMPDTLHFVSVDGNKFGFGNYFKDLGDLKGLVAIHNDGHNKAFDPPTEYPRDRLPQCQVMASVTSATHSRYQPLRHSDHVVDTMHTPTVEGYSRQGTSLHNEKVVFTLPPDLDLYVSRWNQLYYKILEVEFNPNNSLRILNLSNNLLATWIGPITGLNKLNVLDLANNFAYNVSFTFFDTLTSLTTLNASRNYLRNVVESDSRGRWFQHLDKLEVLCLSGNYINIIKKDFFKGLVNLQTLDLSHNEISVFDANITQMENITQLDLSYNNINFLPKSILDHLDHVAKTSQHTVTVDMTFNPIACTCEHIDFLTWIENSPVQFTKSDSYSCLMSDGSVHDMTDIFQVTEQLQNTCSQKSGILVGAVSCFICMMVVLAAALVYRYRWKLRYLYHASRLFYHRVDSHDNDDFIYDAFVSYSSENSDFVHRQLLEELETRGNLRLNIHNRDFTPGRPIPSNIVDAVQKSRHTLVVLTRELLQSDWCHYEMQMATMEASHTGRDVLIFLLYEDVPSHELPRDVFYNLQASTYITFPVNADPSLLRDFWARLVQAIKQ